jgi:hypothetical protein
VDVRENVVLAGVKGVAIWRRRNGEEVFTGLVRTPLPPVSWQEAGFEFGAVRLVDRAGPLDGECRVISPEAFLKIMRRYDDA